MPFFAVLVDTQLEPIFGCKSGPPKFSSLLGLSEFEKIQVVQI